MSGAGHRQTRVADCPFCPGNEAMTPPEVWRSEGAAGGWKQRAVPNRYPLLDPEAAVRLEADPFGRWTTGGRGRHQVLIESRRHDWDLSTATTDEVCDVLLAYRDRYRALRAELPALIALFRNYGQAAGTSLPHPHAQLVALPVIPAMTQRRLDIARRHLDESGTSLYVELLEKELADGRRILIEDDGFVAYQPYASSMPFETWIVPHREQASFGELADESMPGLARMLRDLLAALRLRLDNPPYNLVVSSVPPADEEARYFVWHLRVLPRITVPAGLELGTGIAVNPTLPEATAGELRNALAAVRRHPQSGST